ncbi:hypothetical protein N7474_005481 [Penicillium riverlandense]|uniref:uncharacterized protein n=1 Tax=Penicillium riverlandense TaxID=1903569 RepID=UPI002547A35B|nr:uncharacterized protein N7474_005481 [Penicillium riverlandense]KAJ5819890.1 hypothetical protein N7474_005481 [Penicillium riverlandense]
MSSKMDVYPGLPAIAVKELSNTLDSTTIKAMIYGFVVPEVNDLYGETFPFVYLGERILSSRDVRKPAKVR